MISLASDKETGIDFCGCHSKGVQGNYGWVAWKLYTNDLDMSIIKNWRN